MDDDEARRAEEGRRRFLDQAGKVALAVPPALTLLLVAEGRHYALALSDTGGVPRGNAPGFSGNAPGRGVGNGNGINGTGNPRR